MKPKIIIQITTYKEGIHIWKRLNCPEHRGKEKKMFGLIWMYNFEKSWWTCEISNVWKWANVVFVFRKRRSKELQTNMQGVNIYKDSRAIHKRSSMEKWLSLWYHRPQISNLCSQDFPSGIYLPLWGTYLEILVLPLLDGITGIFSLAPVYEIKTAFITCTAFLLIKRLRCK